MKNINYLFVLTFGALFLSATYSHLQYPKLNRIILVDPLIDKECQLKAAEVIHRAGGTIQQMI